MHKEIAERTSQASVRKWAFCDGRGTTPDLRPHLCSRIHLTDVDFLGYPPGFLSILRAAPDGNKTFSPPNNLQPRPSMYPPHVKRLRLRSVVRLLGNWPSELLRRMITSFVLNLLSRIDSAVADAWKPAQERLASYGLSDPLLFTIITLICSSGVFLFQYLLISVLSRTSWWDKRRVRGNKQPPPALVTRALIHDFTMQWIVRYILFFFPSASYAMQLIYDHSCRPISIYFMAYPVYKYTGMLDVTADLPPIYLMIPQFFAMNFLHATMFYWIHRTLHIPFLYRTLHKQHHEFKETAVPVSEYFHPIEDFFNVVIAAGSPAAILGWNMHPFVYNLFLAILTWDGGGSYLFDLSFNRWINLFVRQKRVILAMFSQCGCLVRWYFRGSFALSLATMTSTIRTTLAPSADASFGTG